MFCEVKRQRGKFGGKFATALALLIACSPLTRLHAAVQLQGVTLRTDGDGATLHLQLSGSTRARSFMLENPRRLVVDLPATRKSVRLSVPAVRAPLESLRVGPQKDGSVRVIVGLAAGTTAGLVPAGPRASVVSIKVRGQGGSVTAEPPRPRAAPVTAAHAPAEAGRAVVVAIDAGHGGEDPGASGRGGTREKHVTLAIARRLLERLGREPGVRAVLTRDGDRFVPLRERADRARRAGADLFVSIHADAVRDRDIDGASVYVLSERGASSEAARILADRENAADLRGVPLAGRPGVLASVLVDLSQAAALGSSVEAAGNVLSALDEVGAIRKREVQYAGFAVLKSPDMPSMLVETAYISNPSEEAKLRDAAYQSRLANAIAGGVLKYFRLHPPDGTRMALERRRAAGGALQLALNQ
jgi:N-acetylmuramoyl-L-alanine amidase